MSQKEQFMDAFDKFLLEESNKNTEYSDDDEVLMDETQARHDYIIGESAKYEKAPKVKRAVEHRDKCSVFLWIRLPIGESSVLTETELENFRYPKEWAITIKNGGEIDMTQYGHQDLKNLKRAINKNSIVPLTWE